MAGQAVQDEQFWHEILPQLAGKLDQVSQAIASNTYIVETKRQLRSIIEDARNETMILFIGNKVAGKSTIINALLGDEFLERRENHFAMANTFLRYGEQEGIRAFFYDGVVEDFSIDKLNLLTRSDSSFSQILQEHLDYIDVYIKNELLKTMTLIDTLSLVNDNEEKPFLSDILLNRVDDVFWVLRPDVPVTENEIKIIERTKEQGITPYCVINEVEDPQQNAAFVSMIKNNYSHLFETIIYVAALEGEKYLETGDIAYWQASRLDELVETLKKASEHRESKTRRILLRFIEWLERFEIETSVLPEREPLISAISTLQHYSDNVMVSKAQHQQSLQEIKAYEEKYKELAQLFMPAKTLYQLMQVMSKTPLLRDDMMGDFLQHSEAYLDKVLAYRNAHREYTQLEEKLRQQVAELPEETRAATLANPNSEVNLDQALLNDLYAKCESSYEPIDDLQQEVLDSWHNVEAHLRHLHKEALEDCMQGAGRLMLERAEEMRRLQRSVTKLNEFQCLIEAQGILRDVVWPYIKTTPFPLKDREKAYTEELIRNITAVDLSGHSVLTRSGINELLSDNNVTVDFAKKYKVYPLALEEDGMKSADIPPLPTKYQITA